MRGRKPRENTVAYKVYIDASLFAEVQLLLLDPVSGKIKYGEFRKLNEQLLRQWVEERKKNASVQQEGASSVGAVTAPTESSGSSDSPESAPAFDLR